jgi:hypothetical protein
LLFLWFLCGIIYLARHVTGVLDQSINQSINQSIIMKGSSSGKSILRVTLNQPIQPTVVSYGIPLLCTGLFLALHPLAWILLQSYRDKRREILDADADASTSNDDDVVAVVVIIVQVVLDTLAHWILDLLPQVASSMLTLYLATVAMVVGTKCIT